jgi:hypothetical protein
LNTFELRTYIDKQYFLVENEEYKIKVVRSCTETYN